MNELYRILLIRFNYLNAKCLFPIILNWQPTLQAQYEMDIMRKIIDDLKQAPGVNKVRIDYNKVGTGNELQEEFNEIIGDINYNTETSQLRYLNVDLKKFVPLMEEEINNGFPQKFYLHTISFPIRVVDPEKFTLQEMSNLPMLVIEI